MAMAMAVVVAVAVAVPERAINVARVAAVAVTVPSVDGRPVAVLLVPGASARMSEEDVGLIVEKVGWPGGATNRKRSLSTVNFRPVPRVVGLADDGSHRRPIACRTAHLVTKKAGCFA